MKAAFKADTIHNSREGDATDTGRAGRFPGPGPDRGDVPDLSPFYPKETPNLLAGPQSHFIGTHRQ